MVKARKTDSTASILEETRKRKSYTTHLRLDTVAIQDVELNVGCRDGIVPVLRALQHVYSDSTLTDRILGLIGADINENSRTDTGRKGMDYWHICVLAATRLGCDYTYDQLQDLSDNHRDLRAIMGLGSLDEAEFHHKTLRNTFCLLRPSTIEQISQAIVAEGHKLCPGAIEIVRADSFVMETNIHYPPRKPSAVRRPPKYHFRVCAACRRTRCQWLETAHSSAEQSEEDQPPDQPHRVEERPELQNANETALPRITAENSPSDAASS